MGKVAGWIVFIIAVVFLGYMVFSGQVDIAWERVIIYILFAVGAAVVSGIRQMNQKKQDEKYLKQYPQEQAQSDALWKNVDPTAVEGDNSGMAGGANAPVQGVVRVSAELRGIFTFVMIFMWFILLVFTALAAADDAFSDLETLLTCGFYLGLAAVATAVLVWLVNHFCCEIYYTATEVTVKEGRKENCYRWDEIGEYKQINYMYSFRNREGKKIFRTNSSYEGFDGFMAQYRRTRMR